MPPTDLNASIAKVQNEFALKLLREFATTNNLSACVSPPAVAVTLALALSGAKDKTSEQLSQLLAKGTPKYRILPHFGALLKLLDGGGKKFAKFNVESVCKLCVKSDIGVLDAFKASVDKYFGAHLELVDFGENMKQVLATTAQINKIVQDASHGTIKEVLKPELFNDQTHLLLLSAFYFKGKWAEKFDPDLTQKKAFFVEPTGTQKEVYMMQKTHLFDCYDDNNVQVLALPCDEVSLYVTLPKERFGLSHFLANLTVDSLFEMAQKCQKVKLNVALPKIKLDQTVELSEPLKKLGLINVFENANFQGIAPPASLAISKVLQKSVLEIDEQGGHDDAKSEAGLISPTSPPLKFVANHPFAIFVVSHTHQTILLTAIYQG
uniref:Serpin domain-containing protein n=1 Tax=Globodera rostochiensis TaxID=31243 RepID=A0A914H4Z7_GLORO